MKKFIAKCTWKGCGRVFDKNSEGALFAAQAQANQAVAMHVARTHTKKVITPSGHRAVLTAAHSNGHGAVSAVAQLDRRSRTWRDAHPRQAKPIGRRIDLQLRASRFAQPAKKRTAKIAAQLTSKTINFCPECGCNIRKIAMGMVIADTL